ncbi:AraC family transcriptional regulator [Chitinophaga nivalis]|uniref:AraC family transcriptional regulator n=1 Tax=Chitinophaga nivalis TaxID=2991709 RepID=A0ABT3IQB9_9BACT|nr:AraC family transcriptional regulator [Chitinophaga nivalis]MCW3464375.1 AraC family transcriptional regulator [Chitinophaga nivalis]MCW3485934.1 AraC family transcriptional regulator [Chitinophaga nivalis]
METVAKKPSIPVYNCDYTDGASFFIGKWKSCEDAGYDLGVPHRHNGYSIDILVKGSVKHAIDFRQYEVQAPAIMLMEPQQVHQHEMATDAEIINIYFTSEFLVPEMQGIVSCWRCIFSSGLIPLNEEQIAEVMSYADLITKEYNSNKLRKEAVIRNLLNALVIACGRISEPSGNWMNAESSQYNMARQFKMLVDQHFHVKPQVSDYAEMLFVSPGHLNDTVKALLGRNAKNIIDEKRIMEAKRLLYWEEHSIKQIAAMLNFEDDAYFNRFFKKHTGYTPVSFQRTIREKYN